MHKEFETFLNCFNKLDIKNAVNFELMNEILISHHSTAIEGSSLTEEETLLLLTEGITAKGKPLVDHNMVKDHQDALVYIVNYAKEKHKITPQVVQSMSAMVMKTTGSIINAVAGSYDSSKGDFRKSMVHVGARYFTNYQKVPKEVESLCDEINNRIKEVKSTEEIYNLAFDAHFYLVSIHPFADGNGRVSRLLMNYILEYHQQPLAIIFKEDKLEYYKVLEDTRATDPVDIQLFRDFMYSQQVKYLSLEIEKVIQSS